MFDEALRHPEGDGDAAGFVLSRQAVDEEELLLIAVRPSLRGRGIGSALMERFIAEARLRQVTRLFLEMREGNPAEALYLKHLFAPIGRRKNYYNRGALSGIDAISFALEL